MNKILVIGCTEITKVIVPMLSADPLKVSEICVASKNKEECDELKKKYKDAPVKIVTAGVDVTNEEKSLLMMSIFGPTLIVNLTPSYLNKTVMEIALKIGASYIDAKYCTDETGKECRLEDQIEMSKRFFEKNLLCVTGCSFDTAGLVCLAKEAFRRPEIQKLESVDIVDIIVADEDNKVATPLISDLKRLSEPLRYIEDGEFKTADALSIPAKFTTEDGKTFEVDGFDNKLLDFFHKGMPQAKNVCYFSQVDENYSYLVRMLDSIGMLSTEPISISGASIAPIDYLAAVLPKAHGDSESRDKNIIGVVLNSLSDSDSLYMGFECKTWDQPKKYDVDAHAFFNGVTLLAGILLIDSGKWNAPGVFTALDFDAGDLIGKIKELGLKYNMTVGQSPLEILVE